MDDTVKASIVASSNQKGELELRFTSKTGDKMQVTFFNSENTNHIVMWNSTKSKVEWGIQPSVSQSPLAGAKKFMMKTTKARVTFNAAGGHRGFLAFSSGNSTPWLAVYTQNTVLANIQRLGNVTVEKVSDDVCDITAPQWSMLVIIPLSGTIEITDAQPSVSRQVKFSAHIESATLSQNVTSGGEEPIMVRIKTDDPSHDYALCVHKSKRVELYDYVSEKSVWPANLTSLCS